MGKELQGKRVGDNVAEQSAKIFAAIEILRNVTRFIKVAPFIYAGIFILCMIGYLFCSDDVATALDITFYVSPMVILTLFRLSYQLKLCNWYRLQCALPLFSQVLNIIDTFFYEFGTNIVYITFSLIVAIFVLSLINTYHVFIKR